MDRQEIISELKRISDKERVLIYRHDWDNDKRIKITVGDILSVIESEDILLKYRNSVEHGRWDCTLGETYRELINNPLKEYLGRFITGTSY